MYCEMAINYAKRGWENLAALRRRICARFARCIHAPFPALAFTRPILLGQSSISAFAINSKG